MLWVLAGNERAQHFYRPDGWRSDGQRRDDQLSGAAVTTVHYRYALP